MLLKEINKIKKLMLVESKMVGFDNPQGNFVIIAGGPGAGKSYVTQNFIDLPDYKQFNVDNYRVSLAKNLWGDQWKENISTEEGYTKILDMSHTTSDPRNLTIKFLKNFIGVERGHIPNIVYDAGGGQREVMNDVINLAKENGYNVTIVHVVTELDKALNRNQERDRSLPRDMVIDYHDKVRRVVKDLIPMVDNYWIVDNTHDLGVGERASGSINRIK
jgi:predicted kinase